MSDCFCIELAVCEVALDVVEARETPELREFKEEFDVLSVATLCEEDAGNGVTCIGGRLTGFAFFGSVDDIVFDASISVPQTKKQVPTYLATLPAHHD